MTRSTATPSTAARTDAQRVRTARVGAESTVGVSEAPGASSVAPRGSQPFCVTLPYPPSTNNLYATVNGHRVKTQAAKDYATRVAVIMAVARGCRGGVPKPPYALRLTVWMPDRQRRDLSNTIKALEDALFKSIGKDDRHVVRLSAVKRFDIGNGRVDVVLEHVDEEPLATAEVDR